MHHRIMSLLFIALLCISFAQGCGWAGRTAGKVVNTVETGADHFEQSYEQERQKK